MNLIVATSSYPLHPDDSVAAAGLFVRDLASELARQGHTVRVVTQDRPGNRTDDAAFRTVRYRWRGNKPLSDLRLASPRDLLAMLSVEFFVANRTAA